MDNYRLIIKPITPFTSEIQSDTLFGQFLWMVKFVNGDGYFNDVLNKIKNKEKFFIVSSAFENEKIELPQIPFTVEEDLKIKESFVEKLNGIQEKDIKEALKEPDFAYYLYKKKTKKYKILIDLEKVKNELNSDILKPAKEEKCMNEFFNYIKTREKEKSKENKKCEDVVMRNIINRLTWTTKEDSLFYSEKKFFPDSFKYYIYIKTDLFTCDQLKSIFEILGLYGYGADTSIGCGQFIVEKLEKINIEEREDANYVLSLSNYIPDNNEVDLENSYYSVLLKKGKLGCAFATGIENKEKSFFKTPLIMIKEGALLKIKTQKEIYGKIIENINYANPDIIHTGQAFTIKLKINLKGD